ncbi:WD40 repeat-like protein [Daldinia caldariorum]|uniref:WD40 repeat-like protein n=1 Tax=Daldinia caldariorum TaxID=326644 RepID=UPI00200732E0|nr:WD40 repeat-like protein [Daldinia caldariorum]KAI1470101.1 WD40 repeat-like protein [Daldinia caldariorum]
MRLRKSNQGKRFNDALAFDLSDGEQADLTQQARHLSDNEFVVDAQQSLDGRNKQDIDAQDSSDFESLDGKQSEARRKKNKRSWAPNPAKPLGEVQPYPTDPAQKWTRTYVGPVKRWTRLEFLVDYWFGDVEDRREIFNDFIQLWYNYQLLPPKLPQGSHQLDVARNGWMPGNFTQYTEEKYRNWYERYLATRTISQTSTPIDKEKAFRWFFPRDEGKIHVLLGHVLNQKEHLMKQGDCLSFSDSGLPIEDESSDDSQIGGWLLDVGGIVLSMGWAPIKGQVDQLLAMSVIPHSDQAFYRDLNDAPKPSELKDGAIQIWKFGVEKDREGISRPARSSPKLIRTICFYWGRVNRMQWCPVPLTITHGVALLAVLCGDGKLRIIEIKRDPERDGVETFEEMQEPLATIKPPKEHSLEINCFSWLNINRIVVGLSDGSVTVWSISPCQQLQRHPVHSSPIMDIVSGYPSKPFLIATMPMGGVFTLTDLNRPTAEKTYHGNPLVSLQPNVLAWSDQLRGFASIWPTSFPGTSTVSFVHSRVFPLSRHICTVEGQTSCLAFGTCHPFLLVGSSDGSVWALNVMRKVLSHREKTHKLKIFQHEYAAPPPPETTNGNGDQIQRRGGCRILHGFLPQLNSHPLGTRIAKESRVKRARGEKKAANKKSKKPEDEVVFEDPADEDEDYFTMVPAPIVVHESQTRITALSWNPNVEFSWWAAAAMGSGLVRIMDLGIENIQAEAEDHVDEPEQAEPNLEGGGNGDIEMGDGSDDDVELVG